MREAAKVPKGKITAKTESKKLVGAYGDRAGLLITNYGSKLVSYALGETAVAEEGPGLAKEGGSVLIENYSGPVSVITKEGESVVGYSEF